MMDFRGELQCRAAAAETSPSFNADYRLETAADRSSRITVYYLLRARPNLTHAYAVLKERKLQGASI